MKIVQQQGGVMVKSRARRATAVYTAIALVAILSTIALALAGAFSLTLNFTQKYSNQDLARNEAEGALAELLANLSVNKNYGLNGEEIRGRLTARLTDQQAFHVLTFRPGTGYPHSTNTAGGVTLGSLGRTLPTGTIHAVATGFCRGEYATIEAIIERPPYPYGVSTSGPIVSPSALVVKGVSTVALWAATGLDDRPGHLLSNSLQGVSIGTGPEGNTT
ncbi:MAG: hypothetical protein AB1758_34135, partial [Candidatus Eremiobacterota bacterium]